MRLRRASSLCPSRRLRVGQRTITPPPTSAFLRSCRALDASASALRPAQAPQADLLAICREALKTPDLGKTEARLFFETHFEPVAVTPHAGSGFLTGYYEPEFQGSRTPDATYRVPLLDRPEDLVTVAQGETLPGLEPGLQAARRTGSGYEPYPDRAAIEEGALGPRARPIVFLSEPGEAFIIHVQGSARIRLGDGSVMRVAYAGRNGRPYTSIGRLLVQQGEMDLETMTLAKLMGWLKDHPGTGQGPDAPERILHLLPRGERARPGGRARSAAPASRSFPAGALRSTARSGPTACRSGSMGSCP